MTTLILGVPRNKPLIAANVTEFQDMQTANNVCANAVKITAENVPECYQKHLILMKRNYDPLNNHEIWVTCPECNFTYDARQYPEYCPNCGCKQ